MELEPSLLAEPAADDMESLTSRLDPDTLGNEQTWPTDEELSTTPAPPPDSDMNDLPPPADVGTTPKRVKKVPKGTSAYQAAWIVDDSDDEEGGGDWTDEEQEDLEDGMDEDGGFGEEVEVAKSEFNMDEDQTTDGRKSVVAFRDLDVDEEDKQSVPLLPPLSLAPC